MSWNLGLQINNLATKLNSLSGSVIANPLVSTLNANNFSITNANNVALQSLKDSSLSNGTNNQVLNASLTGLTVWKTPVASTVFYVDATSGNDLDKGSSIFPLATIQSAIDKCGGNTTYYTIYVNPGTYPENLIISTPRINLVGVQSSQNTKSVFISSVNITTQGQSGPSLDIIAIQNFVIGGLSNVSPAINIANFSNYGGYSLYINNCELLTPQPNSVINFSPTQLNTRLYISRTNINNVINTATASQIMVNIARGELWQFDYVNITNRGPYSAVLPNTDATPLLIGNNAQIISGITNSNITSNNQVICFRTNQSNGVFSIVNSYFSFNPSIAGNLFSAFMITAKNTINLNNNIFINIGATTTASQQPFILVSSGSVVYSRNNTFSMTYAPTTLAQAPIFPVGNYSSNTTQSFYIYLNNVYTNSSPSIAPIPNYPASATILSAQQTSDLNKITFTPTYLYYFPDTSTNVSTTSIATYSWNSPSQFTSTTQTFINSQLTFLNYSAVSNTESSSWVVSQSGHSSSGWGNTASTFGKLLFPAVGQYVINWCFQANSNLNVYGQINKNMPLPASGQPSFNTQTMLTCNNPVSPGTAFPAIVNITSLTDYITITVFNFNVNQSINLAGRQVLCIVKVA